MVTDIGGKDNCSGHRLVARGVAGHRLRRLLHRARQGPKSHERVFREGAVRDCWPGACRPFDGSVTAVLYNASTYQDADGGVAGVFAAARDIGELRQADREMRALNAGLERRVAERTRELDAANRELRSSSTRSGTTCAPPCAPSTASASRCWRPTAETSSPSRGAATCSGCAPRRRPWASSSTRSCRSRAWGAWTCSSASRPLLPSPGD